MKFKGLITFITVFCLAFFTSAALAKKSGKSDKSDRHSERSIKSEKSEKSARSEKSDKSCKSHKSSRKGRGRGHGRGHNDCDAPPPAECIADAIWDGYSEFKEEEIREVPMDDGEEVVWVETLITLNIELTGNVCSLEPDFDFGLIAPPTITDGLGTRDCFDGFLNMVEPVGDDLNYTATVVYACFAD